ncbi:Multiple antibiotic resistance protein MarR [Pseudobythopirellula maris]|uniref:Multiple antibiotic resistance protein MarR n=1 Tax=Pseudobythopirellula maris TaxID=2527991 RepID=A0A5C5ZS32_9BACT|nr:MarR family transcriptional regulator [Pseudobythopirellula maris]TWT89895.1 Multiple antibiotic resistance protein MarR [Pseudobythopirellula maris]
MLTHDFESSIGYWIARAHQEYMRAFNEMLAPHGITFRQAQVLGWLAAEGPMSQSEMANRLMIEPPSLVGILNRSEAAGLVERRPDPEDGRVKLIHPLPEATRVWELVAECGQVMLSRASAGLSEEELATLHRVLLKVRENVTACEAANP